MKPDWAAITNTKQVKGETVTAYLARLKTVVDECAGLPEGTDNTGVLKHNFVNGLLPNVQGAVRLTCIAWEAQNLEVVMQHAKHAEQNDEKKNTDNENKLQTAQYMFYQTQSNNQMPRNRNQPPRNGRWHQGQVGKKGGSSWAEVGVWLTEQMESGGWTWHDEGYYQNDAGVRAYSAMQKVTVHRLCSEERKCIPDKIDNNFDLLSGIPETLWAKDKYDIGQIKNAMPFVITPMTQHRPFRPQYPLSKEAVEGISKVHAALVEKSAIVPCQYSPINSPILPVRKASVEWRIVQDLRMVNVASQPRSPIVPNPSTILSEIPNNATHFTVIDLANAFFSIPVHQDSQYWLAFTFKNRRWTWTVMPQGYTESPTVFTEELSRNLVPPKGSTLIKWTKCLKISCS
ncbi:hypothetical protein PO909_030751 [Leuciscus waleckii]